MENTKIVDMNGNEFIEVEDKTVIFNNNKYSIYEVGGCTEINTISIDGETLGLERDEVYEGKEVGYVVEAMRIDENKFKLETIWLCIEEMGWSEAEIIENEEEILFTQNILKEYGIELIQ